MCADRGILGIVLFLGLLAGGFALASWSPGPREVALWNAPSAYAEPAPEGDYEGVWEDCLDCHDDRANSLIGSPHYIDPENPALFCSDCHTGWEAHLDDPDVSPGRPDSMTVAEQAAVCTSCHVSSHVQTMSENSPHAINEVNCSACHGIHDNQVAFLLKEDEEAELCLGCHTDVRGHFNLPSRHPVWDKVMKCSECHMRLDEHQRQYSYAGLNETCFSCHGEFRPPFPYEHQATLDWSTEDGGCLNCHNPHGSALPRLLKQPYEGPNYPLCSQCHSVPGHKSNSFHGTQWANTPCYECHVDIHGSYDNRRFLTPSLQADGCFAVACHQY